MLKFVSAIIPCRNEKKFIVQCLDSVITQDYPKDRMEILVADGMSEDGTQDILQEYSRRYSFLRWVENPKKIQACALNNLIGQSKGEIIIRLDAHSNFPKDYVSNCVKYLGEYKVDNIGGIIETLPGADTNVARSIAWALATPFGVGGSKFRLGVSKPTMVETVPLGCYRREIFSEIGLFNENLIRNEDNEFNARLLKAGGRILLHPGINSSYFARPDIRSLADQHFRNGYWCVYGIKFSERPFFLRHLVPMGLMTFLLLSLFFGIWLRPLLWAGLAVLGLYGFCVFITSAILILKRNIKHFPYFLLIFPSLHFSYGIGSLCGLVKLLTPEKK